jgi:hypothetical protein
MELGRMSPPTIARLKSMGASAFRVTCAHASCLHSAFVTFAAAGVEDRAPFPSIAAASYARAAAARAVGIMPDWRGHNASGVGRR